MSHANGLDFILNENFPIGSGGFALNSVTPHGSFTSFHVVWLMRFFILSFFGVFDSFRFQSRCLDLLLVEHKNTLPIEAPSFSKLCYCLCTHPVKYIAQRHISAK